MMDFNLHVIHALSRDYFTPSVTQQDLPEGVKGTFARYEGGTLSLPEDSATLVVTDDAALARTLCADRPERLHVVLIGGEDDCAAFADALEDVWSAEESGEALRRRYLRLLRRLGDEFDLWFYKHTLLATIDTVPDMLWYKRIDGIHMLVNDAFSEIVQKPKSAVLGKDHFDVWDVSRPEGGSAAFACAESEEIAISSGKMYVCDEPVKTRNGMKQFTTYKTPLYDMFGNVFGTVGVGHDITGINNMGVQLTMLMENLPFPMCIFTPEWKVLRMNSNFSFLAGVRNEAERDAFDYRAWKAAFEPIGDRTEDSARHAATREFSVKFKNALRRFVVTELELLNYFGDVSGYFCTMEDVTYRRAYEQSILDAANTDMLTGIYNRRYFDSFVRGNLGRPFHLLYMDLDHFKEINDVHGHKAGDAVLVRTARLIQEYFPHLIAARLGGDEFVVVDDEHDLAVLEQRCDELEAAVEEAFSSYGQSLSISIGIARTDGSAEDIDRVLQESDARMYEIKKRHHEQSKA